MATLKCRGHEIECFNNNWIFSRTKQLVYENLNIECGHCGKKQTEEGHDGCLGTIDGVMNACCGHGAEDEAYIQFWDGRCIRGKEAKTFQKYMRNQK